MLELQLGKPLIVVTKEKYPDYPGINKHYIGILNTYDRDNFKLNSWNDQIIPYRNNNTGEKRLGLDIFPQNSGDIMLKRDLVLQFYHPLDEKVVFVTVRREPQYKSLPRPEGSPIKAYTLPDAEVDSYAEAYKFIIESTIDETLMEAQIEDLENHVRDFLVD